MYLYTLREVPAEAEIASHILLLRAGFIRKQVAGVYAYLPLGARTLRKIENIVREEMDAIGAQEIKPSILEPAELWQESGRWTAYGPELWRIKNRDGRVRPLWMGSRLGEEIVDFRVADGKFGLLSQQLAVGTVPVDDGSLGKEFA